MAAIKKGMASVGQLKDQCNDAIRKGPDLGGIAERMRIPVAGVHGRNYMKLVRDDVRDSITETALAKGKGRFLPGFGDNLDEEQKVRDAAGGCPQSNPKNHRSPLGYFLSPSLAYEICIFHSALSNSPQTNPLTLGRPPTLARPTDDRQWDVHREG